MERGFFCSAKDILLMVVLLYAIFGLVTCKQCALYEGQSRPKFDIFKPDRGISDANSPDVLDNYVSSEWVSRHSVQQQHSLENICPDSSSFCFMLTLSEFLLNGNADDSDASDASGVQSEVLSSGFTQSGSNLTSSTEHGLFWLLGGRVISCSLYQPDDFCEHPPTDVNTKNGLQTDVSSCRGTLFNRQTYNSKAGLNADTGKPGFLDGSSARAVEIKPSVLDWGQKNMYHPSLTFLTVKNVGIDGVLSIYDPYSSNPQFYPCNFSEILLAPGEVASMCFVFSPTNLGMSSAQLVLQTSFGGFLIQAKGFAVESPYLINSLASFDISSSGRWRKNLSLFNPFNEGFCVEEVTTWLSISQGHPCQSSQAICNIRSMEDPSEYSELSNSKEWFDVDIAEGGLTKIAIRPHKNWEVGPQKTEAIMELDISDHFEGKITGAFCLQLVGSSENKTETVMVPLEAELSPRLASDKNLVSVSLEALFPCKTRDSVVLALSVRNNAPHVLSVVKVSKVGESSENFEVKSIEGVILFPRSVTNVAILSYAHRDTLEVSMNCKILVQINDTRNSHIEIPCIDVVSVCSGHKLDSTVGYAPGINSVDYSMGRGRSFSSSMQPPSEIKAMDTRETGELVLMNCKSQASASFILVLEENEVLLPMVQIGNCCSQWIAVKNPIQEPIMAQLILNFGEFTNKFRAPEMHLQPSSTSILVGSKPVTPTSYGFSIAKGATTEAFIHPYDSVSFGPILFQPSIRWEWQTSALIRNNLSGVEWLSLRGFGGLLFMVLFEGSNPVQSLEFKLNLPSLPNFPPPEIVRSVEGKIPSCTLPLVKEVYAKNLGDFPLEVIRIYVSGSECGRDRFLACNCKGFSLPPGEIVTLQILYQSDFMAATIQGDLELALATGILVMPMKASLPIYLLDLCKRSLFRMWLKKAMVVIPFAASLLFLLVHLLFPHVTAFTYDDFKTGKNSSSVSSTINSLGKLLSGKSSGAIPPKMDRFVRSNVGEEESPLLSARRCRDGHTPGQGHVNPSGRQKLQKMLTDELPETRLPLSVLSNSSLVENSDAQDALNSQEPRLRIGKDKGRKRRKKKSSVLGVAGHFEGSSSQSGNSTPSSPLSPAASVTPRGPCPVRPDMEQEQSIEVRNSFAQAPDEKGEKRECSEPSSKVNLLDDEISSRYVNSRCCSAQVKPSATGKLAGRAVLLPSATSPTTGRAISTWTCHPGFLTSTSTIAPQVRAPGTKLNNPTTGAFGEKVGNEEKFTYDIWGCHLFDLPLNSQSRQASCMSPCAIDNNSESFFVREPQTLMSNSLLKSVSSDSKGNRF